MMFDDDCIYDFDADKVIAAHQGQRLCCCCAARIFKRSVDNALNTTNLGHGIRGVRSGNPIDSWKAIGWNMRVGACGIERFWWT